MRRDYLLEIAIALLAIVFLVIALILYSRQARYADELAESEATVAVLREQIEAMESSEPETGGLETRIDPVAEYDSPWIFPVATRDFQRYTSPVGERLSPITATWMDHRGLDISTVWRAQVVAMADGVVTDHWPVGTYGGVVYPGHAIYGGYVEITHDGGWVTRYAHLDSTRTDLFRIGAPIAAGTPLGRVGNTGRSVRDHLHVEMIDPDGKHANPLLYLDPEVGYAE